MPPSQVLEAMHYLGAGHAKGKIVITRVNGVSGRSG